MSKFLRAVSLLLALGVAAPAVADDRPAAPSFNLRTLDGDRVKLSDFEGKVLLMSFWATWCAPCKQELPILQDLLNRYGDQGLAVVAVNIDDPKTIAEVRRYVKLKKFTFPVPLDSDSKVLSSYNPRVALPFLQIIDRQGRRVANHTGFSSGAEKALEKEVLALLAEKPTEKAAP